MAGWEISGISTFATGFPYDISYNDGSSRSLWCANYISFYACPDVPNQVAPLSFGNLRLRTQNGSADITNGQAAFVNEALGSFGNEGRNRYHGPGINNTNMILAKNFLVVPEHNISIQLRMESDNVFNHTQFSNPTSTYGSSALGVVSSAAAGRQSQLAAKIYF